ncbi:MAG: glycoside hydrolase family 43 protein [Ferruginibacter sp.]|nr:glycoside hydrolase family 43 protein [Ferruginibacter sp.]
MKKSLLYCLLCGILLTACSKKAWVFTSFREPANEGLRLLYSNDGYHWTDLDTVFLKPALDQQIIRDPSIAKGPDGTFHLVFTTAWKGNKGFGYASSKDLVHWSEQKLINVMATEPTTVNIWAPEIFYDDESKEFIIIWASTIPNRFEKGVEAEDNNHRMYYTTTRDFINFSPSRLFLDPGFSVIDAVILKRAPRDHVLILKDNTRPERNIRVAFGETAIGPYHDVSPAFTDHLTEGPSVIRLKDKWLIYFDDYQKKIYDAVETTDFKTFRSITKSISLPPGHKHGTIFQLEKKFLKKLTRQRRHKFIINKIREAR